MRAFDDEVALAVAPFYLVTDASDTKDQAGTILNRNSPHAELLGWVS
jgi:hypothetical protein